MAIELSEIETDPEEEIDLVTDLCEEEIQEEQEPAIALEVTRQRQDRGTCIRSRDLEVADKLAEKAGHYDPTLTWRVIGSVTNTRLERFATKDELQANKDKIAETLTNFKIGISSIKATIGPTITLYEIIPRLV